MSTATTAPAGRVVTGHGLRVALAAGCVALVLALVGADPQGRLTVPSAVLGLALVTWVVRQPGSPAPTVLLLLAVVVAVDSGPAPGPLLVVQAALAHGVHLLASLCAVGPAATRYEPAALLPSLRRWAVAQLLCAPVVLVAWLAPDPAPGMDVVAGLLLAALVGGLVALALRSRA